MSSVSLAALRPLAHRPQAAGDTVAAARSRELGEMEFLSRASRASGVVQSFKVDAQSNLRRLTPGAPGYLAMTSWFHPSVWVERRAGVQLLGPDGGKIRALELPHGETIADYAASFSKDGHRILVCEGGGQFAASVDVATGKELWSVAPIERASYKAIFSQHKEFPPLETADGGVMLSGQSFLARVTPEGDLSWCCEPQVSDPFHSAYSDQLDTAYLGGYQKLAAVKDGKIAWERPNDPGYSNYLRLLPAPDGTLFATHSEHGGDGLRLYALDEKGQPRWSFSTRTPGEGADFTTPVLDKQGNVLLAADGFLHCLSAGDGGQLWSRRVPVPTRDELFKEPGSPQPLSSPILDGEGNIYVASGSVLTCLRPDGQPRGRFTFDLPGFPGFLPAQVPCLSVDGKLGLQTSENEVYLVDTLALMQLGLQAQEKVGVDGTSIHVGADQVTIGSVRIPVRKK